MPHKHLKIHIYICSPSSRPLEPPSLFLPEFSLSENDTKPSCSAVDSEDSSPSDPPEKNREIHLTALSDITWNGSIFLVSSSLLHFALACFPPPGAKEERAPGRGASGQRPPPTPREVCLPASLSRGGFQVHSVLLPVQREEG